MQYRQVCIYSGGGHYPILLVSTILSTTNTTNHANPNSLYFLYHILVIFVFRIFLCSWKMPYMSASLVGGQPGT